MDITPDNLIYGIPAIGVIIGLTEVIKRLRLSRRYIPLVAIAWGIVMMFIGGAGIKEAIVQGIFLGLIGSGVWSGTKAGIFKK